MAGPAAPRADAPIAICLGLVAAAAALAGTEPGSHPWGGDFAGYLLQAASLQTGDMAAELAHNRELMAASDVRVGPDLYPWGLPIALVLAEWIGGPGLCTWRAVGLVSLAALTAATYLLARAAGIGRYPSAALGALLGWQPSLLANAMVIGSDLPFAAVATATLVIALRATDSGSGPARGHATALGLAALCVVGFALRSNGVVTIIALALFLGVRAARLGPGSGEGMRWYPDRVLTTAVFTVATLAGVWLYFEALPDGSLSHARHISAAPRSMLSQVGAHLEVLGRLIPFRLLPGALEPLSVALAMPLVLWGGVRSGPAGGLLLLGVAGHLGLLTLVPFAGGLRYYFPILPAVLVLSALGLRAIARDLRLAPAESVLRWTVHVLAAVALAALLLALTRDHPLARAYLPVRSAGPYSVEMNDLLARLERVENVHRIAFFKPRVMRWRSGRDAILVNRAGSLERVDAVVLHRGEDDRYQLDRGALENAANFRLEYENAAFSLFLRH